MIIVWIKKESKIERKNRKNKQNIRKRNIVIMIDKCIDRYNNIYNLNYYILILHIAFMNKFRYSCLP